MESKKILYIHCGSLTEFQQYQKQHIEYECIYILDGVTLRGRYPEEIICVGTHKEKWNDQEIMESIDLHEDMWKQSVEVQKVQGEMPDENILDYGIE